MLTIFIVEEMLMAISIFNNKKNSKYSMDELEIIEAINSIQKRIKIVYEQMDYVTDSLLIDSCVYELTSLSSKLEHFIKIAKEINLKSVDFAALTKNS